jgi:esterase/lipase
MLKNEEIRKRVIPRVIGGVIIGLLIIILMFLFSINKVELNLNYTPITDYQQAKIQIEQLQKRDSTEISPECKTKFYDHARKTERVIIFFHGYTSCPEQFNTLGKQFYDLGYNVLIPRIPYHGNKNIMTNDLSNVKKEDFISIATESINIANGLGEKIIVSGISGGGVMTAWSAQNRPDVYMALPIAPLFLPGTLPTFLDRFLIRLIEVLPEEQSWWDAVRKETMAKPPYSYPRYSRKGIAELLKIGEHTIQQSRLNPPTAKVLITITSDSDPAVNNTSTGELVSFWKHYSDRKVIWYSFSKDLNLPHDMIDPLHPLQNVKAVYSKIMYKPL